jgi:hypothetical protein
MSQIANQESQQKSINNVDLDADPLVDQQIN